VAGKRVLIVDDDRDTVVICGAQLTHAGYSVTSVSDGSHACDAARLHTPDVILLDYRLPGTTGAIIASSLNADPRCSAIPVIILTADATARKIRFPDNVRGVVLKPCESRTLTQAISAATSGESLPV
jgi:two-component system phosphate regulon response regulator PhoB